jgi:hypothetical protein
MFVALPLELPTPTKIAQSSKGMGEDMGRLV